MERSTNSETFTIGSQLPVFSLRNVDGTMVTSTYFQGASAGLVIFSCNHCPYVKGSESALIEVVRRFQAQGLRAVAINSNDAQQYPEDGFKAMQDKAKAMDLPYPYLYDETQAVARAFDAACTPECYLFNDQAKLVFHGTVNDNPRDAKAARQDFLAQAIAQLLRGEMPNPSFVHPIGCSIKWKY